MKPTPTTLCPTPQQLAQLVSGSLLEQQAQQFFGHIDGCPACQKRIDDLAKRRDPVLAPLKATRDHQAGLPASRHRKSQPNAVTQDAHLSKLIHTAQHRPANSPPPQQDTTSNHKAPTRPISEADFVHNLRRSGLLPPTELDQFLDDLSWDRSKSGSDSSGLAKRLIHNHKLTPFQARLLLRGRWKGLVLGNYTILDKLGQGGMGSVFKARHSRMGRVVCLKVVNAAGRQSQDVIDRFRNEARALASLTHPNIVVAHDANEANGIPYLVMEYIDGDDLSKRVKKEGPLSASEILDIAQQTAEALGYAHGQGVIHRDVKPHNIVVSHDPDSDTLLVKVLDLGLARFSTLVTDNPDASILAAMTNTGVVIGTVDYMSPEQALDSRNADERSDIYSLGCTLYYLSVGRPPFEGETVMQRLVAHRESRPQSLCSYLKSDITPEFNAVIQKMLAKEPANRYQNMNEVLDDLQRLSEGSKPAAEMIVSHPPEPPPLESNESVLAITPPANRFGSIHRIASAVPSRISRQAILVSIVLVIGTLMSTALFWPSTKPLDIEMPYADMRVGGDRAVRNGGDGRALVLVSSRKFNEDELNVMDGLLKERNMDLVTASPNFGTEVDEFGQDIKAPYENINLTDVDSADFDAIFFIGGEIWDLTHKNKDNHQHVIRIVDSALSNRIPVVGCAEGCNAMFDSGLIGRGPYKDIPTLQARDKNELAKIANTLFDKIKPIQAVAQTQ
ncbi:MAG: protein kinase [Pirellulaceae bacterium]|nr:protein kinase [Pirellulaceae bacterium]